MTKKWRQQKTVWLTLTLVALAIFLRTYRLMSAPPALYWEEVALLYDSWSLSETGFDYHGNYLPVVAVESFGDYKPSGYFYALIPWLKIFGPQDWTVKMPSLLAGLITVLATGYLWWLIAGTFGDQRSPKVLSGCWWLIGLAAVNPALIHLSRVGFEANLALGLIMIGICLLYPRSPMTTKINWRWLVGTLALVAAFYTYHSARLVAPLLGIYLLVWSLLRLRRQQLGQSACRYLIINLSLLVLLIVGTLSPVILTWSSGEITNRFAQTTIFTDDQLIAESNACREMAHFSTLSRFTCHRYGYFARTIITNYWRQLSPRYLFFTGDNVRRHATGCFGVYYPVTAIFMILGIYFLGKNRRHYLPLISWLSFWLIIGLLPASLTFDAPHLLRSLTALPVGLILATFGLVNLPRLKKINLTWLVVLIYASFLIFYQLDYYQHYRVTNSLDWQYGYQQALVALENLHQQYPELPINFTNYYGRASIYYFWYQQVDPKLVQQVDQLETKSSSINSEFITFSPAKIQFYGLLPSTTQLVVLAPTEFAALDQNTLSETTVINDLEGKPVFIVGKLN